MILGITGSRSFHDNPPFNNRVTHNLFTEALNVLKPSAIIHGGAKGPDQWAHKWATGQGIPSRVILPASHDRWAYLARNRAIVLASDNLLVCWDEVSGGTGFTFNFALDEYMICHAVPILTQKLDGSESGTVRRYRDAWLTELL